MHQGKIISHLFLRKFVLNHTQRSSFCNEFGMCQGSSQQNRSLQVKYNLLQYKGAYDILITCLKHHFCNFGVGAEREICNLQVFLISLNFNPSQFVRLHLSILLHIFVHLHVSSRPRKSFLWVVVILLIFFFNVPSVFQCFISCCMMPHLLIYKALS